MSSQGSNEKNLERYQLAEIKHARLAMIAFSGFTHQVSHRPASRLRGRVARHENAVATGKYARHENVEDRGRMQGTKM